MDAFTDILPTVYLYKPFKTNLVLKQKSKNMNVCHEFTNHSLLCRLLYSNPLFIYFCLHFAFVAILIFCLLLFSVDCDLYLQICLLCLPVPHAYPTVAP